MNKTLEKQFEVCSYDADIFKKAKVSSLFGFFQEVASSHAETLGFGFQDLAEKHNAFWALSRLHLKIEKYPHWKDKLTYKTWPRGYNRLFGLRDFEINCNNEPIASGSSDWIIINGKTKQIINPETIIGGIEYNNVQNYLNATTEKIKPMASVGRTFNRKARFNDLDMNRHVNSIRYLEWVFDCLPIELLTQNELTELKINYQHEIPANKEVELSYQILDKDSKSYRFMGKIIDTGQTSFLMDLVFRGI